MSRPRTLKAGARRGFAATPASREEEARRIPCGPRLLSMECNSFAGYCTAMSQENVDIVRRVYQAVGQGDTEGVLAAYDPAVEYDFRTSPFRDFLRKNVYVGHEGIRRFISERYSDAWAEVEDHLEELIDAGEHVVSVVTSRGRGLASGVEVGRTHAGVWTIREGRITRVAWFATRDEALEAAGLSD